jgi:MFS family permease
VVIASLVVSALSLVCFVVIESRRTEPLVPRDVMRNPSVRAGVLLMVTTAPCFFVSLLYVPQVLAKVLGYGPLKTGLAMLPMQLVFTAVAPLCGLIAARVGLKAPHTAGLLLLSATGVAFASYGGHGYAGLLPAMILYGLGVGLAYPAVTALIMLGLGVDRAALAVGILFTVELVTGGLATAMATTAVGTSADLVHQLRPVYGAVAVLAFLGALLALAVSPGRQASATRAAG